MAEPNTPYYLQEKLTRSQLLKDENFLEDASEFLYDRTGSAYDRPEKIVDELAEIMRWGQSNEVSMARTYTYAKNANEKQRDTMGKMFLAFDKADGITSTGEFIKDYSGAILSSPATLGAIGSGGIGLLGRGAVKGGMTRVASLINDLTVNQLLKKTTRGQAFRQSAVRGAAIEGPIGALMGAGEAETRKLTGREEFQDIDTGEQAAIGGTIGALFGGTVAGGTRLARRGQELRAQELFGEGLEATRKRAEEGTKKFDVYLKEVGEAGENTRELVEIRKGVRGQLDPLKDSMIGTDLKKQIVPTPEGFKASFTDNVHSNIMDAASEVLHKYGRGAVDFTEDKRITERIIDALEYSAEMEKKNLAKGGDELLLNRYGIRQGEIGESSDAFRAIDEILEKYGLTREQFTSIFRADMSEWGKTGQRVGQFSKKHFEYKDRLEKAVNDLTATRFLSPEEQKKFDQISKLAASGEVAIWTGIQAVDKFRLGMMTIQTATTIRNTANASVRTALYALDNFFYGALTVNPSRMQSGITAAKEVFLNNSESNYLRLMFAQNMPDEFQTLFRQMADIEADSLSSSKLVGVARFLNRANTFADNAFKRAIFMSELQARVGRDTLLKHMKEGTFGKINRDDIAGAMEEALHFTYQKSFPGIKPKGAANRFERGLWNGIANGFIGAFSNPATSIAIPFPRFVANSLEFMYKHAPLIGIADPALFYRYAKAAGGKGFTRHTRGAIRKRIAQQATGSAMLFGAIQLRAQQGPTANWWEVYDEETGKYRNALAFYGPFAPWMLVADKIVRTYWGNNLIMSNDASAQWDTVEKQSFQQGLFTKETGRDFLQAAFGSAFRTGFTGEVVKEFTNALKATDVFEEQGDISKDVLGEKYKDASVRLDDWAANFAGNYLNTFAVPLGQLRDIMAAYDPKEYAGMKESVVVNPVELFIRKWLRSAPINSKGEYQIGPFNLGTSKEIAEDGIFKAMGGKGTPAEDIVTATSLPGTRKVREEGILRQLTGIGSPAKKNLLEKEMQKHQLLAYKLFPKIKNDPELTRRLRLKYQELVEKSIVPYLRDQHREKYTTLKPQEQRMGLEIQIQEVVGNSLDVVERDIRAELKQNQFASEEKREQVNDQLTRVLQTRFRKEKEIKQIKAVQKFKKKFGEKPNLDRTDHLEALLSTLKLVKTR